MNFIIKNEIKIIQSHLVIIEQSLSLSIITTSIKSSSISTKLINSDSSLITTFFFDHLVKHKLIHLPLIRHGQTYPNKNQMTFGNSNLLFYSLL